MYANKLVVAVKVEGKVLKESGDTVKLPFGCEYSVIFKNLESRRCKALIEIDGKPFSNYALVIEPNKTVEVERFISDLNKGNKFKFIERTKKIEKVRGVNSEDGLIRVEYSFEDSNEDRYTIDKVKPSKSTFPSPYGYFKPEYFRIYPPYYSPYIDFTKPYTPDSIWCSSTTTVSGPVGSEVMNSEQKSGITVPGAISTQSFIEVEDLITEKTVHVMVLKLVGQVGGKKVNKPLTVQCKAKCVTCGTVSKAKAKFCQECGTSLVIV